MNLRMALILSALLLGSLVSKTSPAQVLQQTGFDTETTSTAETLSVYGFASSGVAAIVQGGELRLTAAGGQSSLDIGSFAGDLLIRFDTRMLGTPGSINVGLRSGDNHFIFHPGYPGGAFRIDGPGGHANQDMGFTPSTDYSQVSVTIVAATGLTTLRITNAAGVYEEQFMDANYVAGSTVLGFSLGGAGTGLYDNLLISAVPEPPAALLVLAGGLFLARQRRAGPGTGSTKTPA
jgi:hypothetical protein